MPKFNYKIITKSGKNKSGTIEANSVADAKSKLTASGDIVMSVSAATGGKSTKNSKKRSSAKKASTGFSFGKVIKEEELTVFTRQLATLLEAGLPLLRSIEVMTRQEPNKRFKAVLEKLSDTVKSGSSFSDGLSQHPKVFDRLYVNMVKAGEAGGVLELVLARLAGFKEKALKTKKKVQSAMVYPFVVVGVAVAIVIMLMVVVVPKFQSIFDDMLDGAALPGPTQLVINISNFLQEQILASLAIVAAIYVLVRLFLASSFGAKLYNGLVINIPKVGDLVRKVNIARITRTFGTLLSSGVPILQAIKITKDITGNYFYAKALNKIHDKVRDGESLSKPMELETVFPNMVTSMVDVGEETGELDKMLNRIADNYDEDVDNAVAGITSIIEPIMIVFLALAVGFIVIALFLPIVEIIKQLTG
ncbi:MAG: pilus assembly protein PilC [Puniceicoccaceae bacterium]|nr:pilus assembly protein PilC [Puniceicoccaceae bacterium]RCL29915.1 MAG: type II secretion system F family protein [Puniceicoccaceae bacterium]